MKKVNTIIALIFICASQLKAQSGIKLFTGKDGSTLSAAKISDQPPGFLTINAMLSQQYKKNKYTSTYLLNEPVKRKKYFVLKSILLGGAIGITPALFGQSGAYVAVLTFPVGLLTGTVIGLALKPKKHDKQ